MKYVFLVHLDNTHVLGAFSNIDKAEDFVYKFQCDNPEVIGNVCIIYRVLVDDTFSSEPQFIKSIRLTNLGTCIL